MGIATSRKRLKQLLSVSFYRNALYLMVAHLAVPLTGLVFWVIAARFYSPEDVGVASAVIAAMTLLALLSTLGLEFGVVRFLPESRESGSLLLNSCFTVAGFTALALCAVFLGGIGFWSPALLFLRQDPAYLAAFVVFTMTYAVSMIAANAFVGKRRAGFTLAHGLILGVLRLPLLLLLASFLGSLGIFASWGLSWVVALIISLLVFMPRVQPGYRPSITVSRKVVREMARFSFANYFASLLWAAPGLILSVMVLNILGAELNAYFFVAWAVGGVLATVPLATSMSLFAEGSTDEASLGANTRRSLKLTFLVVVPAVIVFAVFADKLLLLFGAAYSGEGEMLLRLLALSALPIAINHTYLSVKRVQKKLTILLTLSAFIPVSTLVLTYLLLPWIGITGAGIAWLGSQGVVALGIIVSFILKRAVTRESLRRSR